MVERASVNRELYYYFSVFLRIVIITVTYTDKSLNLSYKKRRNMFFLRSCLNAGIFSPVSADIS